MSHDREAGFTLVETAVVVALVAVVIAAIGVRALAGPSVAVAAAATEVVAAFDEARRTANAFDAATVVFAPRPAGSGFAIRIYRHVPGDPAFAPANGPAYASDVSAGETAAPLGPPGIAFSVDHRGDVVGFAAFSPGAAAFDARPCPAGGAYEIALSAGPQMKTVAVPCTLAPSGTTPAVFITAPPAAPASLPSAAIACAGGTPCPLPTLPAAPPAYALTVNPATIAVSANQTFAFTATDTAANGPPGNVAIASVQGNCDTWSSAPGAWMPSGTSFSGVGRSGSCTIGVTDTAGNVATVAVAVAAAAHAQVDDQCNVPYGTFVYTDATTAPPTDHLGNGQPCTTPAPGPTATPAPPAIVELDVLVAYNCSSDRSACWQVDSDGEYLFADGTTGGSASAAQQNAFYAEVAANACTSQPPGQGQFANGTSYADSGYARLYQEANDNGIDGYLTITVTVCPP